MIGLANVLAGGVAYGFVLFLMAAGLSITFGLMGFANMAHSAFAMIGAYAAVLLIAHAGVPFLAAVACAGLIAAIFGAVFERLLFRRLYRQTELNQALLTIGVVYVAIAATTYFIGPDPLAIATPAWLDGTVRLGQFELDRYRVFLIAAGLILYLGLNALIDRTLFGARIRAAVDNRRMTESCGVDVSRLYALAFALGSGMAGIGGALSVKLLGLDPNFAIAFLTEILIVVSVGGLGSIQGALLAAILFGVLDNVGRYLAPEAGAFIIYAAAVLILTLRPNGLLGRRP